MPLDLEQLNNLESLTIIFEEFIQQQTAYFMDFADGEGLLELTMKMLENSEDIDQLFDQYTSQIKYNYF